MRLTVLLVCIVANVISWLGQPVMALDLINRKFGEPRIYFVQASANKAGRIIALKGQSNFLRIFLPGMEDPQGKVNVEALTFHIDLPAGVTILPGDGIQAVDVAKEGVRVKGQFDSKRVRQRSINNKLGVEHVIWYRVDDSMMSGNEFEITLHLDQGSERLFTDRAKLVVADALVAPKPVSPEHFRLWLHYGPLHRQGEYDELADYLRKAGINSIQVMAGAEERMQAMQDRGFFVIAQRAGSYHAAHKKMGDVLEKGQAWFDEHDTGQMTKALPHADAVIWDFEPSPATFDDDPRILKAFGERIGLEANTQLTADIVKTKYLTQWIDFRQDKLAMVARHWADWSRSLKPDIVTILTEGRANVFDPSSQVDYRKMGDAITIYDPMNFAGAAAIEGMKRWRAAAPDLKFAGCQNVAYSSISPVFISAQTIGLQTLTAAIMGNAGTSVYPGQTMDGENFIVFNRVMTFLNHYEKAIWNTHSPKDGLLLSLLPKEDTTIELSNGKSLRNTYPDWQREAVTRTCFDSSSNSYLAVIANWSQSEPCHVKLSLPASQGQWMVIQHERKQVYTLDNQTSLTADQVRQGLYLSVPPGDYAGFEITPYNPDKIKGYEHLAAEEIKRDYNRYAQLDGIASRKTAAATSYDDFDDDGEFEYVIETSAQKVWISQRGHVVRWQTHDGNLLETRGMGLFRDQLYLPVTERSNTQLDSRMTLRSRKITTQGIELIFDRTFSIDSSDGLMDLTLSRRYMVAEKTADLNIRVSIQNTSLSMQQDKLKLSYRVHNHLLSDPLDLPHLWIADDSKLVDLGMKPRMSMPAAGLDQAQRELIFSRYEQPIPLVLHALGEYYPQKKMLLTFAPDEPAALLQGLRWRAGNDQQSTIEWIYLPVEIASGQTWSCAFQATLRSQIQTFDWQSVQKAHSKPDDAAQNAQPIFQLDFNDGFNATIASGKPEAKVTGSPKIVTTPNGKGIALTGESSLAFSASKNINLTQGKMAMRFMPLWDGADGVSHAFVNLRTSAGSIYVRKLADGRLLMNMIDGNKKQHYVGTTVTTMKKGQWHELVFTWDTQAGRMAFYLDGKKSGDRQFDAWQMGELTEKYPLFMPGSAESIIEWITIWDHH